MKDLAGLLNQLSLRPLSGSSYISLPEKLSPKKGLISIKNKDQKCFLWCHFRHINLPKENPERIQKLDKKLVKHITTPEKITEEDKKFVSHLDYDGIEFPVQEKYFGKIEIIFALTCLVMKMSFLIYISDQKCEDSIDLLLLIDDDKSYHVYIKDFDRFMFHKTKNKNKKCFCKSCLQCFSNANVLTRHKKDGLSIDEVQSVKVEEGTIEFNNYFKQLPVQFKICANFECNLKSTEV